MTTSRLLILADDLSGAAECAAACRRFGMDAVVRLDPGAAGADAEALALDLDTHSRPAVEAERRSASAAGLAAGRVLYRKIDSTVRGHVGLEAAATLDLAGPGALLILSPAHPRMGRTVRGGGVFVDGGPLETTEIWRSGGGGLSRPEEILRAAGVPAANLGLETVRGPGLAAALSSARAAGARAVVCDAEAEADLDRIVSAGLSLERVAWAGSAGMIACLARALSADRAPAQGGPPARRRGGVLVVVGSASSVSHAQLDALASEMGARRVAVSPRTLTSGEGGPAWTATSAALSSTPSDQVVALSIEPAGGAASPHPALTAALGRMAAGALDRFGALAATGGETARAVLDAAGVSALRVHGEVEAGVVMSNSGDLAVVTKAGAFGDRLSLVRAVQALQTLPLA